MNIKPPCIVIDPAYLETRTALYRAVAEVPIIIVSDEPERGNVNIRAAIPIPIIAAPEIPAMDFEPMKISKHRNQRKPAKRKKRK